jgi:hypothetical protein
VWDAGICSARKILGGNADGYENKRVAEKAIRNVLKTKAIKIDGRWKHVAGAGKREGETGTLSAKP